MHEGSIIHALLDIAFQVKEKENITKVAKINIVVGKLHQVIPQSMQQNFDLMKLEYKGLENAVLVTQETDVQIRCRTCKTVISLDHPNFNCPHCGSSQTDIISGKELYIDSLESC